MAKKTTQISAVWQGGIAFEGKDGDGSTVMMDSPIAKGGPVGVSPMRLLLMSLAGCTAMDVISILEKKRQDVTGFDINVSGTRADAHPRYYEDIEIEFVVRGRSVDPKAVARAIKLSEENYCSVSENLRPKTNIVTSFRVEEEE